MEKKLGQTDRSFEISPTRPACRYLSKNARIPTHTPSLNSLCGGGGAPPPAMSFAFRLRLWLIAVLNCTCILTFEKLRVDVITDWPRSFKPPGTRSGNYVK